jgi:hypothetical protein
MEASCSCETSALLPIPTPYKDPRAGPKTAVFHVEEFLFIKIQRTCLSWHGKRKFILNFKSKISVLKP